jgi:enoyl-CoA hydratase/carnithine racemase
MDLKDFLDVCASNQALAHRTADHKEAIEAFFEKRDPVFSGN